MGPSSFALCGNDACVAIHRDTLLRGVEPEPTPRKYYRAENGQFTGEESPSHETISAERAAEEVFKHLSDWFEEFRLYHRKDGKVVKEGDDLMCATRYALMMLRHAQTIKSYKDFRRPLVYPKSAVF